MNMPLATIFKHGQLTREIGSRGGVIGRANKWRILLGFRRNSEPISRNHDEILAKKTKTEAGARSSTDS